ncbi:TPA: hypothetical protein KC785_005625, partial [Escherichia coli O146]
MIFIINHIIISDMMFTGAEINDSRYDLFLDRILSDGVCRMDEERVFSLSYEQLTPVCGTTHPGMQSG